MSEKLPTKILPIQRLAFHIALALNHAEEESNKVEILSPTHQIQFEILVILVNLPEFTYGVVGLHKKPTTGRRGTHSPFRDDQYDYDEIKMKKGQFLEEESLEYSSEEALAAAQAWVDYVLDARNERSSKDEFHRGQELLLRLAQRGIDWPEVRLSREELHTRPMILPESVKNVFARLRDMLNQERNAYFGGPPLPQGSFPSLVVGNSGQEIPEGLSFLSAMLAAPREMSVWSREEIMHFYVWFNRKMDDRNKHWADLKSLGYFPANVLQEAEQGYFEGTVKQREIDPRVHNQVRSARRLQKAAWNIAENDDREFPTGEDYRKAWEEEGRTVTKIRSFDEFLATSVGRNVVSGGKVSFMHGDLEAIHDLGTSEEEDAPPPMPERYKEMRTERAEELISEHSQMGHVNAELIRVHYILDLRHKAAWRASEILLANFETYEDFARAWKGLELEILEIRKIGNDNNGEAEQ